MTVLFIALFGMVIILAFEMRHRVVTEELERLQEICRSIEERVAQLRSELVAKQDANGQKKG